MSKRIRKNIKSENAKKSNNSLKLNSNGVKDGPNKI